MNNINNLRLLAASILALTLGFSGQTYATAVDCGDPLIGTRTITVDPALVGGYCYAQNGNFIGDDFSGLGPGGTDLDLILKNSDWGGNYITDANSGTWSFDANLWNLYDELFIAFHFGHGGECNPDADTTNNPNDVLPGPDCDVDPDSFIVQLESSDNSGSWQSNWGDQWGLSNLYLLGHCDSEDDCTPIPEPGSIVLLGLGLIGLSLTRRKRK